MRSQFWWPPLCYSDSKRRPGQLLLINCLMSPTRDCCLRFLYHLWGDLYKVTQALSGFTLFPLTSEEKAVCSQLQHPRAVFEYNWDKSEYLHLFNSQGAWGLKRRVLPIAPPLHNRLSLEKIPLDLAFTRDGRNPDQGAWCCTGCLKADLCRQSAQCANLPWIFLESEQLSRPLKSQGDLGNCRAVQNAGRQREFRKMKF